MTTFMQVFLDEVNTSSCLGLFKEIIIDRSLDGEVIQLFFALKKKISPLHIISVAGSPRKYVYCCFV